MAKNDTDMIKRKPLDLDSLGDDDEHFATAEKIEKPYQSLH